MAHIEASLDYSAAQIVSRKTENNREIWNVEGLLQPGLKSTQFTFEQNALRDVDLQCQYDAWPLAQYQSKLQELRAFFDARYHQNEPSRPISKSGRGRQEWNGYGWRFRDTRAAVFTRSFTASSVRGLSVCDLVIHYESGGSGIDPGTQDDNRWKDEPNSPAIAEKLRGKSKEIPIQSAFGITGWKLLNTSDREENSYALQLAVELRPNAMVDASKAVVQVNFYDVLAERELVLTDANVNYDWRSHRDWKEANPETLTVTYARPLPHAPGNSSTRKFFGYTAAVYYDRKLQSVLAEPLKLLNLFPVRTIISPFEEAQNSVARGDFVFAAELYQRLADQGNLFALENLAWFYAHGKGVEKDYHRAALCYERASLQNTPRALNAVAWFLATCPDDGVRNGAEAVRQATRACELSYWQEWKYVDTLAACWSSTGNFDRAIACEQQAIDLAGTDQDARNTMERHLASYQQQRPWRE